MRTVFIVNPMAGNRRSIKAWPDIERKAKKTAGDYESLFTEEPGQAIRFARDAALNGPCRLVCVGGDGTLNEVVNGLMAVEKDLRRHVLLGYVPCGTGCDFAKTVNIPANPVLAADIAVGGKERLHLDICNLSFRDNKGRGKRLFFHNVASFGLGGEVDDRVNRGTKIMGGFLSFIKATLVSIMLYKKKLVRLRLDEGPVMEFNTWNVALANGQFHGGGMWVAQNARLDDGLLKVIVIGDLTLPEVFRHLPKLYNGRLPSVDKVHSFSARHVEAWSGERVLLDVDGEQPGRLPLIADILPKEINIVIP